MCSSDLEVLGDALLDVAVEVTEAVADPEVRGQIQGAILFEVVSELVSGGAEAFVTSGRACHALGKLAQVADDAGDLAKAKHIQSVLRRFADGVDQLRTFLKLCFVAGTPVQTPEGPRSIESLRPGDWVLSRPEQCDPTTTPARTRRILNVFETHPVELYHLKYTVAGGSTETLTTTGNHPFYEVDTGRFIPARDLGRRGPPYGSRRSPGVVNTFQDIELR